jgi:mRNA interferase HicA
MSFQLAIAGPTSTRHGDAMQASVANRTAGETMTGHELLRHLRELGRREGKAVRIESARGKGSHQTVYFGPHRAVIPDLRKELKTGTLAHILKQLRVPRHRW